jgi:hypothetical protein
VLRIVERNQYIVQHHPKEQTIYNSKKNKLQNKKFKILTQLLKIVNKKINKINHKYQIV